MRREEQLSFAAEMAFRHEAARARALKRMWWRRWVSRLAAVAAARQRLNRFRSSMLESLPDGALKTSGLAGTLTVAAEVGRAAAAAAAAVPLEWRGDLLLAHRAGAAAIRTVAIEPESHLAWAGLRGGLGALLGGALALPSGRPAFWKLSLVDILGEGKGDADSSYNDSRIAWVRRWLCAKLSGAGRVAQLGGANEGETLAMFSCRAGAGRLSVCVKVASPHADAVMVLVPHPDDDDATGDTVVSPSWAELRARLHIAVAGGDGDDGAPLALAVLVLPGTRATRPRADTLAEVAARLCLADLEGIDSFVVDLTDPGHELPEVDYLPAAELDALLAWLLGRGANSPAGAVLASAAFRHAWWERVRDHGTLRSAEEELAVFQCAAVAPRALKVWFVKTVVAALGSPEDVWAAYLTNASVPAAATSVSILSRLSEHSLRAALPRLLVSSVCAGGKVEPTTMGAFAERFLQAVRWSDTSVRLSSGARGLAALHAAAVDARDWVCRLGQATRALAARVRARAREWPAREFRPQLGLPEASSEAAQWGLMAERLERLEFHWVAAPADPHCLEPSAEACGILSELGRFLAANGGSEEEALPALKALVGEDALSDAAEADVIECHFLWQLTAHLLLARRVSEMDRLPLFAAPPSVADLEDWDLRWAHELRLGEPGREAAIAHLAPTPAAAGAGRASKRLRPSVPEDGGSPHSDSDFEVEPDKRPNGPSDFPSLTTPLSAAVESELKHGRCFEDLLQGALGVDSARAPVVVAAVLSPTRRSSRADVSRHEERAREAAFNSVLVRASSFHALPFP